MSKNTIAKAIAAVAGLTIALGAAMPAAAVTAADLQAQINALMAELSSLNGTTAVTTTTVFTRDLTIGSTGSDVTALQQWLMGKGYSIPAGATGYFGAQTQSALGRYQAAAGISPAAGYFGPVTRANVNAMAGTPVTTGTGTGTGTGTVTTTGGSTGTITTPGVEGILSITQGPISNTVANVGQTQVPVLTVRAQAQQSDIAIQRITVDLGTNTNIYNKIFNKLYVVDNATGNVLASTALNSSTVVQSGNDYIVSLTGFSDVVPAGTYKDIVIKADINSSIDSTYLTGGSAAIADTFMIPGNGVRGIDGAGVDQYGPISPISQTITINKSLVDNAQANFSISASTPLQSSVPVTDTTDGQYQKLPVFSFNLTAQNDSLHLHNATVQFSGLASGNTGTTTAVYLFNGSTQVSSASVVNGVATFPNITDGTAGATVPAGQTTTFTVAADVSGVTAGSLPVTGSLTAATVYNSQDSTIVNGNLTGLPVTGNIQTVLGKGPAVSLGVFNINKTTVSGTNTSTSTIATLFNVNVTAVGSSVMLGTQSSSTPAFVFGIYKDGVEIAVSHSNSGTFTTVDPTIASTTFTTLPSGVTQDGTQSFTLSQNQTVTLPVTFSFQGNKTTGVPLAFGNYAVGIDQINYVANGVAGSILTQGQTLGEPQLRFFRNPTQLVLEMELA